jgi:hypothetical protein
MTDNPAQMPPGHASDTTGGDRPLPAVIVADQETFRKVFLADPKTDRLGQVSGKKEEKCQIPVRTIGPPVFTMRLG